MIVASAQNIVESLAGKWRGGKGMCRCPAHADSTPSMLVSQTNDGRPLLYCYAGCAQMAVIDALRRLALWPDGPVAADPSAPHRITTKPDGLDLDERKRRMAAWQIWSMALPLAGTLGEKHLRELRGITGRLPDCLRFVLRLRHPDGQSSPAIVARVSTGLGVFTAIQRIYIADDGGRSSFDPRKLTLGPMVDGAVRLFEPRDTLGIAEGVETALAAHVLFRIPTWACLGAKRLGKVTLPSSIIRVIIFADNGEVGRRESYAAARRYELDNISVIIRPPDEPHADHNDWLQAGGGRPS